MLQTFSDGRDAGDDPAHPRRRHLGAGLRYLGAIPDNRSAMLYSLGALTTYGDTTIHFAHQWKMLGGLEAVNGMLLFGLTTAFLFAMIQRVLPPAKR